MIRIVVKPCDEEGPDGRQVRTWDVEAREHYGDALTHWTVTQGFRTRAEAIQERDRVRENPAAYNLPAYRVRK